MRTEGLAACLRRSSGRQAGGGIPSVRVLGFGLVHGFPVRHSGVHLRPGKLPGGLDDQFRVEGLAGLEHEVDGPGDLVGEDGVALEGAMLGDEAVGIGAE